MCNALTSPPSADRTLATGLHKAGYPLTFSRTLQLWLSWTMAGHIGKLEDCCSLRATAEAREAARPPPTITRFVPQPTDPPPFPPPFYRGAPGQGRQRLRGHGWCDLPGCSGRRKGPEEEGSMGKQLNLNVNHNLREPDALASIVISFQQL